jgi:hypothetical protein
MRSRRANTTSQRSTVTRTPIDNGGTQTETTRVTTRDPGIQQRRNSRGSIRDSSPTRVGSNTASGVGLLEAEFFGTLFLLILLLFTGKDTYANKIMSTMKRGTLVMILFFVLALIAGVGPNASKIAKGIGALVFVATLLTTPGNTLITDLDSFFKADWTGTAEHGTDVGSADTGTSSGTSSAPSNALGAASGAIQRITQIIESFGFGIIK